MIALFKSHICLIQNVCEGLNDKNWKASSFEKCYMDREGIIYILSNTFTLDIIAKLYPFV